MSHQKDAREDLDHWLEIAWEGQRKRQKWAAEHPEMPPNTTGPSPPSSLRHEWREPINRADSIGLLGVLVGTFFVIFVPTIWYKLPVFVLLCFGFAYLIWLSHWTYRFTKFWRVVIDALVLLVLNFAMVPQLIEQWHIEHLRSELTFKASAPGLAYPDGDHYGIDWSKDFAEVRLTVTSKAPFPIQNLNLSVWTTSTDAIAGMTQSDKEPQGCVIRRPREQGGFSSIIFRANDGSRLDIAPFMNDMMNEHWPIRDHYDLLCQRILEGESVPLVIATITQKRNGSMFVPPSHFHVTGDYEMTPSEGSKRISVNEVVPISMLPPWK
jgi:hypothetical protein